MSIKISHNTFTYDKIKVFFKHTDYHGFVHIYNYLEWMSYAREAFFSDLFQSSSVDIADMFSIVTINVEYNFIADAKFGDDIKIVIFTENVRKVSFDVCFEFYLSGDGKKIGLGRQTLVFLDKNSFKPTLIPEKLFAEVKDGERKDIVQKNGYS